MSDVDDRARKKQRGGTTSPFAPLTCADEVCGKLRKAFASARPFPHVVLESLCDGRFLEKVRDEIISNLKVDYKETDIFKVFQTRDLGTLDPTDEGLESLLQLREGIYDVEFRRFVESVTGCPELTGQVDCSCNVYPKGGHLLCHDDVIGSRCVSYIIYLTDPEQEWTEADGGALELYPLGPDGDPECVPERSILPKWNQMVIFRVEPDVSFHSVGEVLTTENHRLSISGWFHTAAPHPRGNQSSLQQLQHPTAPPRPTFALPGPRLEQSLSDGPQNSAVTDHGLTTERVEQLKKWINGTYLQMENVEKIFKTFQSEGSIQLRDFLNPEPLQPITTCIAEAENAVSSKNGDPFAGWSLKGPPHKQRYMCFEEEATDPKAAALRAGNFMKRIECDLFQSEAFCCLLHEFTGLTFSGGNSEVRCFRPGSDYTVAVYNELKQETLDAVLCFVNAPDDEAQSQWDDGEVGGFEAYLLADLKETAAADVYRADDDDSGVLSVSPVCNTLNLVLSDDGLIKFLKYVSAAAPGCRWDISTEYTLHESSRAADEDDDSAEDT